MDGQQCDRCCARAAARILLANLSELYMCSHRTTELMRDYQGEYRVDYESVTV